MYSDETSKFGRSLKVFAVTGSDKNSYLLGLREMHSKSSETVLDTLKQILSDIDSVAEGTNTGKKILTNIKNTMSGCYREKVSTFVRELQKRYSAKYKRRLERYE